MTASWRFETQPYVRQVRCGAIQWRARVQGSGPGLLLVHGTGACSDSFDAMVPALAQRFTVVAPDLPGHAGTRSLASFVPTLPAMAAALDELLDTLAIDPVIVVGHSAGAAIVSALCLCCDRNSPLVVGLAPALTPLRGVARLVFPAVARVMASVHDVAPLLCRRVSEGRVERVLRRTGSTPDHAMLKLYADLAQQPQHVAGVLAMLARWDLDGLWGALPRLARHILLVAGEKDRAVPLAEVVSVAARLHRARLSVLPGAGHLLHEEHPSRVVGLVLEAARDARILKEAAA